MYKIICIGYRIICIKLALIKQQPLNIISAYTSQVGCQEEVKQNFWNELKKLIQSVSADEFKIIEDDLNGHVDETTEDYKNVHGNFGYGTYNNQGRDILELMISINMKITNTFFQKRKEHLITYKSGGANTQIDSILMDSCLHSKFTDCKVIPGEPLTAQHKLLVACGKIKMCKNAKITTSPPTIK